MHKILCILFYFIYINKINTILCIINNKHKLCIINKIHKILCILLMWTYLDPNVHTAPMT